jgi:hypothetical protein
MPTNRQQSKPINARRFAALLAGFDLANPSEEEAISKARAMRRMAAECNLRIVDLLEAPDVRRAIDEQMQPRRQQGPELEEAVRESDALRAELTARTRDMRKLAEMLTRARRENAGSGLRSCLVAPARHSFGAQSWIFEAIAVLVALCLILVDAFGCSR